MKKNPSQHNFRTTFLSCYQMRVSLSQNMAASHTSFARQLANNKQNTSGSNFCTQFPAQTTELKSIVK